MALLAVPNSTQNKVALGEEKEPGCLALHKVSFAVLTSRLFAHLGSRSTERLLERGLILRLCWLSSTKSSISGMLVSLWKTMRFFFARQYHHDFRKSEVKRPYLFM